VQGRTSTIGTGGFFPTQQPVTPFERDTPNPAPGQSKNEVREIECVILYWSIRLIVNSGSASPDPFITFRLRRNQATILSTIDFEPLETGTKAKLLSIPILIGENFDFQVEQFGSGNTNYTWLFAGKLGGAPSGNGPPPPPDIPIQFNVNSTLYNQYQEADLWGSVIGVPPPLTNAEIVIPFQSSRGEGRYNTAINPFDPQFETGEFFAGTPGFIRRTRIDITLNTLNKDFNIAIARDGVQLGTIFLILAGQTGSFTNSGNTPINVGERYSYHFQTTDQIDATGDITIAISTDIEWGNV
jgi:hypothetical protein